MEKLDLDPYKTANGADSLYPAKVITFIATARLFLTYYMRGQHDQQQYVPRKILMIRYN